MGRMTIRGELLHVDVEAELEAFDWYKARWTPDKLLAASPFRDEHTPSFFVRLEETDDYPAGVWSDSGNYDDEWTSGNFPKLLSYLMNVTYEEAEDYLEEKYGIARDRTIITLRPHTMRPTNRRRLNEAALFADYSADPSEYLLGRGISEEVQRKYGVLHKGEHIAIPWRGPSGRLENVKYRSFHGKTFWYERGATPIQDLVYGIDLIWRAQAKVAIIGEAEIDSMSWLTAGFHSIACGGSAFRDRKVDLIASSPIETLIIASDNDNIGRKLGYSIGKALAGRIELKQVNFTTNVNDANEGLTKHGAKYLRELVENAVVVPVTKYIKK